MPPAARTATPCCERLASGRSASPPVPFTAAGRPKSAVRVQADRRNPFANISIELYGQRPARPLPRALFLFQLPLKPSQPAMPCGPGALLTRQYHRCRPARRRDTSHTAAEVEPIAPSDAVRRDPLRPRGRASGSAAARVTQRSSLSLFRRGPGKNYHQQDRSPIASSSTTDQEFRALPSGQIDPAARSTAGPCLLLSFFQQRPDVMGCYRSFRGLNTHITAAGPSASLLAPLCLFSPRGDDAGMNQDNGGAGWLSGWL